MNKAPTAVGAFVVIRLFLSFRDVEAPSPTIKLYVTLAGRGWRPRQPVRILFSATPNRPYDLSRRKPCMPSHFSVYIINTQCCISSHHRCVYHQQLCRCISSATTSLYIINPLGLYTRCPPRQPCHQAAGSRPRWSWDTCRR